MGRFGPVAPDPPKENLGEASWHNPLVMKRSVVNPDAWLSGADRCCGWLFGRAAFCVWLAFVASALVVVAAHAGQLRTSAAGVLAAENWFWLGLCWLGLKTVHELSHGLVCKRYGGNVRDAGLLFVLFMPVAYVDMTSAWRFRSKWHRIHASLAGMYAELFVASVAAWIWSRSTGSLTGHIAFNVMLMASITTLLFNANPLLRFDGYYVLADVLEIPNLASHASQTWRAAARWFFLGLPGPPSNLPRGKRHIVRWYGLAALAWRTVVSVSLVLAASVMFYGAGIVLAAGGVICWWLVPCAKAIRGLWPLRHSPVTRSRFVLMTTATGATLLSLFTIVPWVLPYRAPAVVEYAPLAVVRADSSGFVVKLLVRPGDHVAEGQTLAVLENPEQSLQRQELELSIERSELRARMLKREGKLAEYQAEHDRVASLELKLAEKAHEVEALVVRAPQPGVVIGRGLPLLLGTYVAKGDELLAIAQESGKELRISVAQHDVQLFSRQVGATLRVLLGDGQILFGTLTRLEPHASPVPPHQALGANCGGPLPVVERRNGERNKESVSHEFLTPRISGTISLASNDARHVFSGQVGEASFHASDESFGQHVVAVGRRWLKTKLDPLTASAK
jgi:putative peptide zinc metalloprotease protein